MRYDIWKTMLPGIIVGTFCGSLLAPHISGAYLRAFFAIFILLMGIQMFRDAEPQKNSRLAGLFLPAGLLIGFISTWWGGRDIRSVTFFIWAAVVCASPGTATALCLRSLSSAPSVRHRGWSREGLPMYYMASSICQGWSFSRFPAL
jgi:apolipoprotein N-acyltransferase